jgi:hypothetical protein
MMRFLLPAALAAALLTGFAEAYAGDAGVTIIGQGTASCGTWTSARRDREALCYEQWVVGFLSGIGYMGLIGGGENYDPLQRMDADAVWAFVDNYCQANPLKTIKWAAVNFLLEHPR